MENKTETELAIFKQVCEVNGLDPQVIREAARRSNPGKQRESENVDALIREAFRHRASELVADLEISSNNGMTEGKEYTADGDPAAPSFTINEDYIREAYPADEAEKVIAALGQVQLPVQA